MHISLQVANPPWKANSVVETNPVMPCSLNFSDEVRYRELACVSFGAPSALLCGIDCDLPESGL
jgi:hypothetical protein